MSEENERKDIEVLVLREGPAANCSSIGSVVDTLFVTAVVGGALFAAVSAALSTERVVIVGGRDNDESPTKQGELRATTNTKDDDAAAR